jgi:hypothetical protein
MGDDATPDVESAVEVRWLPLKSATWCLTLLRQIRAMNAEVRRHNGFHPLGERKVELEIDSDVGLQLVLPGDSFDDHFRLRFEQWTTDIGWLNRRLPELLKLLDLPAQWGKIRVVDENGSALSGLSPAINGWHPFEYEAGRCLGAGLSFLEERLAEAARSKELPPGWESAADGTLPDWPVRDIHELVDHPKDWHGALISSQYPEVMLDEFRRELRNARRSLRHFIAHPTNRPRFDDNPADIHETERQLELLIDALSLRCRELRDPGLGDQVQPIHHRVAENASAGTATSSDVATSDKDRIALLRSSFASLKSRFQAIADRGIPTKVWLIQHHSLEGDILGMIPGFKFGNSWGGASASNPGGWAILSDRKTEVEFPRFTRWVQFEGGSETSLKPVSIDAARLLRVLPDKLLPRLWDNLPIGTDLANNEIAWVDAVFELAWREVLGSPLRADKFVPMGIDTRVSLSSYAAFFRDFRPGEIPDLNPDWFSTLDSFAIASVYAIDIISNWIDQAELPLSKANSNMETLIEFPAGRDNVPQATRQLALPEEGRRKFWASFSSEMGNARRDPRNADSKTQLRLENIENFVRWNYGTLWALHDQRIAPAISPDERTQHGSRCEQFNRAAANLAIAFARWDEELTEADYDLLNVHNGGSHIGRAICPMLCVVVARSSTPAFAVAPPASPIDNQHSRMRARAVLLPTEATNSAGRRY